MKTEAVTLFGQHTQEWWENFWANPEFSFGPARPELIQLVIDYIAEAEMVNPRVVDVASGDGRYAIPLAVRGLNSTAIELTNSGTKRIKSNAEVAGTEVKVVEGDILTLPVTTFEVVVSSGLLEEFDNQTDQISAVKIMQQMTEPGGLFVLKFCLEIKDRGVRVADGLIRTLFDDSEWEIREHQAEQSMRDSNATIQFENKLRTETIIAIRRNGEE